MQKSISKELLEEVYKEEIRYNFHKDMQFRLKSFFIMGFTCGIAFMTISLSFLTFIKFMIRYWVAG